MNKKTDILKDLPEILNPNVIMNAPNEIINIYNGLFIIKQNKILIELNGQINYEWFPNPNVVFRGDFIEFKESFIDVFNINTYDLLIDGFTFGQCYVTQLSSSKEIEGVMIGCSIKGDKSIPITKTRFEIPNLRDFSGDPIKDTKNIIRCRNRLILDDTDFRITIDKSENFNELYQSLKSKGGYIILYTGELEAKKGAISYDKLWNVNHCLLTFLTFLNGRRCSPQFIQGIHENDVKWTDYTSYFLDAYKYVPSWPSQNSIDGINRTWNTFSKLWKDENDKHFLTSAVHWYVEANSNSGFLEGSIIMIQVALELIYNWLIIEKLKLLVGKDGETISASNKIRLLLSQINCKNDVPNSLINLKSYIESKKIVDGIEAFVQIRNAIIHSQEDKRKRLINIPNNIRYEAQQLGLWYIEISLLHILDFKGKYFNRCSGKIWDGEEEYLPN